MNSPMISPPEIFYHFIKLTYLFKLPLKLFYFKRKKTPSSTAYITQGEKSNIYVKPQWEISLLLFCEEQTFPQSCFRVSW